MNNLKELNPISNDLQETSEDPPGFIYPTYRAAQTVTKRVQRPLKCSHQGVAYVSSAVGGSVSTLSFEDTKTSNRLSPSRRRSGGIRDRVRGFSRENRTNLLRRLASINRSAFNAFKGRIISISFISSSWYEVTGEVSEGHLRAGTRVVAVQRWKQVTSYVERYMAKPEEFLQGLQTGRIWGVWNENLLPVRWETVEVSLRDAFRIRRIYRKLARRKGSGSLLRVTVFVRHENVVRLLGFLGYQLE
jgi:hypothetical protein